MKRKTLERTMSNSFLNQVTVDYVPFEEDKVYDSIFNQYERVIIESLITSFGLDFLVRDQHGGDVDTVLNVRKIGKDKDMVYKNCQNQTDYETRGTYDYASYHNNTTFRKKHSEARKKWQETGQNIPNEYRDGADIGFYGHTKAIPNDKKAELDHIIECKSIHDDRGRVLSGLNGVDLANAEDNLAWTDKSLNASMGAWAKGKNDQYKKEHGCDAPMEEVDIKAYVEAHPDLDEKTKARLMDHYRRAKKAYDKKIEIAYYTSRKFFTDTTKAALKVGFAMGLRQALGLVFSEIWFAVKKKLTTRYSEGKNLLQSIAKGVEIGFCRAKKKYKELWDKFIEGSIAGFLSSLTNTLTNIFFTTAKSIVKIMRQSWASLVEATKILLFNPDCLPFGERIRATAKIIATGASVVAGSLVGDLIAKTGIGSIPVFGDIVQTFCSTLTTGILSCSLLYLLDRDSRVARIVNILNSIPTVDDVVNHYKFEALLLEDYCAKLMDIDIDSFRNEIVNFYDALSAITPEMSQPVLNGSLKSAMEQLKIVCPYGKYASFSDYMETSDSTPLTFKITNK